MGSFGSTLAGAIGVEAISGDVDVRTSAGQVTLANHSRRVSAATQAGKVRGTGLASGDVEVESNAGGLTLPFNAPPGRVEARTNAGSVELSVLDERYAVDATSSAGRVQVDVANDPAARRRLVAHSNAGAVWVRRRSAGTHWRLNAQVVPGPRPPWPGWFAVGCRRPTCSAYQVTPATCSAIRRIVQAWSRGASRSAASRPRSRSA